MIDTKERQFEIHEFAALGVIQAFARAEALEKLADELKQRASAERQNATVPMLSMLGIGQCEFKQIEPKNGKFVVTIVLHPEQQP